MTRPARPRTRKLLIFLGGLAAGFVLAVGILALAPVQKWILRRVIALRPGWRVDAERFTAGATGVESRGLVFSMPGLDARVEPLNIRIAPFALLRNRELQVEEVAAQQLRITLSPAQLPVSLAAPAGPFTGLLPTLRSPMPWALWRTTLDGRVTLQEEGKDVAGGEFKFEGGGLAAGQTGEFKYELAVDSIILPPGPENNLRSAGTLRLEQDDAHGVAKIVLRGDLHLPVYADLRLPTGSFELEIAPAPEGERYTGRLTLGASTATFAVTLDATRQVLHGTMKLKGGQELVTALFPGEDPTVIGESEIKFTTQLATGDTDASVTGGFVARDWQKYMPELSAMEEFRGDFAASLERRNGALAVTRASLRAKAATAVASVEVDLLEPLPLPTWPDRALARVLARDFPIEWAQPFLEGTDIFVAGAKFEGEWTLHLPVAFDVFRLEPARPATVEGFRLTGPALPELPPLTATFSPKVRYEIGPETASVRFPDFALTGPAGDRLDGDMTFVVPLDETVAMAGEMHGKLPTLLTGLEKPLPFDLDTRWDATLSADGNSVEIRAFSFRLSDARADHAAVEVKVLQPIQASLENVALAAASADLLRLGFDRLPLDWTGRWLPDGWEFAGEFSAGESIVRQEASGEFALRTTTPWSFRDLVVSLGGKEMFRGAFAITPGLVSDLKSVTAQLADLHAEDDRRNRVTGDVGLTAGLEDGSLAGEVALQADLPALPHSEATFGTLQAQLALKARRMQGNLFMAESVALEVRNADRELLSLDSPQPLLVGFNDKGAFAIGTLAPLPFKTGEIPLEWLRPWFPEYELAGTLEPAEFLLAGEIQTHRLRPVKPVRVRHLSFGPAGQPLLRDTTLQFYPAADVQFLLYVLPTFQLAYQLDLHATDGAIDVGDRRAFDLDGTVRALGNDQTVLPQRIDLTMRADLGELGQLPGYADAGLPASGQLIVRANGDLLAAEDPLQIWARVDGLPAAAGSPALPPVELTARGKVRASETESDARFDVNVRVLTEPQVSDATFVARLTPGAGILTVDSSLKSSFLDLRELLRFEEAFASTAGKPAPSSGVTPVTVEKPQVPAASSDVTPVTAEKVRATGVTGLTPESTAPSSLPFWSVLRGQFDLDIATARFAPYRIDQLKGHLAIDERAVTLSGLSGDMFAGRWEGDLRLAHDPEAKSAAHRLHAGFRIHEFDSARVVETVFPQDFARIEAKIDLHAAFESRGDNLGELLERSSGSFTVEGRGGVVRLSLPKQEMASSLAILGGTVALSPELRALGRLLRKFSEMPVEQLRISGERDASGEVRLSEFVMDSPQARLRGHGRIAVVPEEPLMNRPLELSLQMAARDEMAVILGGMKLLERQPDATGYRPLRDPFVVGGKAGEPDLGPLYDMLARGVAGSRGTWGFLMRKVQQEVEKTRAATPTRSAFLR